jgi:molybdopterin/thiamine biosynthesis adenylyltransferase
VGSPLALFLAQSAVGLFSILDPDTFSASNLSRHVCDLNDLARYKTFAVRDLILRRNPRAKVQTYEEDFLSLDGDEQKKRLQGSDLAIASTDSTTVQFVANEVCHEMGIPSIYIGCYERACAGEILFVIPGKTPCFNCFMEFRKSELEGVKKKERRIPYSDEEPSRFKAEPGLAIDISYVVSVASAYALALLLPGSERGNLIDPERNLILVHSGNPPKGKYKGIFQMPFDLLLAKIKRDEDCLVCHQGISAKGGEDGPTTHAC